MHKIFNDFSLTFDNPGEKCTGQDAYLQNKQKILTKYDVWYEKVILIKSRLKHFVVSSLLILIQVPIFYKMILEIMRKIDMLICSLMFLNYSTHY